MQNINKPEIIGQWKRKIAKDPAWTHRAILRIYEEQTAEERASETTNLHNGVGFSQYDAKFMTSLAKGIKKYGSMTPKQLKAAQKIMPKYASQLFRLTYPDYKPSRKRKQAEEITQQPASQVQQQPQRQSRYQEGLYS